MVAVVVEKTMEQTKKVQKFDSTEVQREVWQEIGKLQAAFTDSDTNLSGYISRSEFEAAMHDSSDFANLRSCLQSLNIPTQDAMALFDILDASADGRLSRREFMEGCARIVDPSHAAWDHIAMYVTLHGLDRKVTELQNRFCCQVPCKLATHTGE